MTISTAIDPSSRITEREKMLAGEEYNPRDPELIALYWRAAETLERFNGSAGSKDRMEILRSLMAGIAEDAWIEPPFSCEYGRHFTIGERSYLNVDCFIQDCAEVRIGSSLLVPASHDGGGPDASANLTSGSLSYNVLQMIKTITRIGNSKGIILDSALLEQANLKEGDRVNLTIHEGGTITLVPEMGSVDDKVFDKAVEDVLNDYSHTLKKLS